MKNLLLKILIAIKNKWFCCHQWSLFREIRVYDNKNDAMPSGYRYTLYCKKCGKFKKIKT